MDSKTIVTRRRMVETLHEKYKAGATQLELAMILNDILQLIEDNVSQGNIVMLRGFGSFQPVTRKAKVGRNPKNPSITIQIPERKTVKFKSLMKKVG